jgi:CRP/FNR family transcriptional regulator, cyclic AMP receptor protein
MLDLVERLRGFDVLDGLDQSELALIARLATLEDYPSGTFLAQEGEAANRLFLLVAGKALVTTRNTDFGEGVLDEVSPGDIAGWSAVVAPYRYIASAHVVEDSTAISIAGSDLRNLFESQHHLGRTIMENIGHVVERRYGRTLGAWNELRQKDLRAFGGAEHVVWSDHANQLTSQALLLGTDTRSPEVIPLEVIYDVSVDDGCLVVKAKGGDVRSCALEHPDEVAALICDEINRIRLAYRRAGD